MSTPAPLVSILIPCYNAGPFLASSLDSALAQSYERCEVIVIDDGSTDDSLQVARSYEPRGVTVISQKNTGQPGALNAALRAAKGAYIQFLDADDLLDRDKIAVQLQRLHGEHPGMLASGAWARFRVLAAEAVFRDEPVWQDLAAVDWVVESWSGGGMMPLHAWLIPKSVCDAAGEWPVELRWAANIDAHFITRCVLKSKGVLFCRNAISYYRSGHLPVTQSRLKSRRSVEATLGVLDETADMLLEMEDSVRTRRAAAESLQRFVYSVYPRHRDLVARAELRVRRLGGSVLTADGGRLFHLLSGRIGWKAARRLEAMLRGIRDFRRCRARDSALAIHSR